MSLLGSIAGFGLALAAIPGHAQTTNWPAERWPQANSTSVMAMDEAQLQTARAYSGASTGAGFIVRDGVLVYSWGNLATLYDVKGVTASLLGATTLGLAIGGGLTLSDTAQSQMSLFGVPPSTNSATGWLGQITIEQLATHSSGFALPGGFCDLQAQPGTEWSYSDCGFNWLADVLTTRYSQDLFAVLRENVFVKLGISDDAVEWRTNQFRSPNQLDGVSRRELASGLKATPDAMARIGLLYLRGGQWKAEQILPQSFVNSVGGPVASLSGLTVRDPASFEGSADQYGLMWWNNKDGQLAGLPTDAIWARGGEQDSLVIVVPSEKLVIVRTGAKFASVRCANATTFCMDYSVIQGFVAPVLASITGAVGPNQAPAVNAGADVDVNLALTTIGALDGSATTDDGLPGNPLAYSWTLRSGPTSAVIANANAASTNVTFAEVGEYVFELAVDDGEITAYDRVAVTVTQGSPLPEVTLSASPPVISTGLSTTLTWSPTNATSCTASGGWTGAKDPTGGSEQTNALTANTTFTLVCSGPGGDSLAQSVTVQVEAPPAPTTLTLTAAPTAITTGGSATLTWNASQASACTASGGWTGSKSATGGTETVTPTATTTYMLRCNGTTEVTRSATVTVNALPAASITSFTASPTSVSSGGSTTLSWASSNATACTASGGSASWPGARPTSGTVSVGPLTATTTFSLVCTGAGGASAPSSVQVTVAAVPPPSGGGGGGGGGGAVDVLLLGGLLAFGARAALRRGRHEAGTGTGL
jgi:CubicO group peptidase (beta-lactamase class C family)